MSSLTLDVLLTSASEFSSMPHNDAVLEKAKDGKTIGTRFEKLFKAYLKSKGIDIGISNSAKGIDFTVEAGQVDMKVTNIVQPQSSTKFKSTKQKIYGLEHGLLLFAYSRDKSHDAPPVIVETVFIPAECTADTKITEALKPLIERRDSKENILAALSRFDLPGEARELELLAEEIFRNPPRVVGGITISNALQWRLTYPDAVGGGYKQGVRKLYP